MREKLCAGLFLFLLILPAISLAEVITGEGPNLGDPDERIKQGDIENKLSFQDIRTAGLRVFTTPFSKYDGYGDGAFEFDPNQPDQKDPLEPGNRPTLQSNGTFLRVNGLDAQSCLECHFIVRNSTIPAILGIGGVAACAAHVTFMPSFIDVGGDYTYPGDFNGRFINPPFVFGSGGVELLAKEMTIILQEIRNNAIANPNKWFELEARGVDFGRIIYRKQQGNNEGYFDTSKVEGIDEDLVVRPFNRKGGAATVRAFEIGAMQFHFGMQPVEVVGEDVDKDGDGISNEILVGELSAIHIWATTLPRPIIEEPTEKTLEGFRLFKEIGCASCHKPFFKTRSRVLTYSFPEVETNPAENVYYEVDLTETANFTHIDGGGMLVPLFSDLKRHDMGDGLAENFHKVPFGSNLNREFITARLWGARDTAPYLHDGRATTITDAIVAHGGEAKKARKKFVKLGQSAKDSLLAFLYSLRAPLDVDEASSEKILLLGTQ
jgi:hypothetical protein